MSTLDVFDFELSAWDAVAQRLQPGDRMSAGHFLALLEDADESLVEDAFARLEELEITLDIGDLPRYSGNGDLAVRLRMEEQLAASEDMISGLEEDDPLRLYLEDLAGIPAAGDPDILAQDAAAGDEAAQAMLVNVSLHRVISLAREYTGYGVLLLDLIQEGSMGLWQGILQYRSGDFADHRDQWIRRYMVNAVVIQARSNGVGQKARQSLEDYQAVDQQLLVELGRNPTMEEIAQRLHITVEEAGFISQMIRTARTYAAAKPDEDGPEEDPDEQQAVEDTAYFQSRQRIEELLSVLAAEDAKLLSLRFGLEGGLPLSAEETGKIMGLTPAEVVARETEALARLRNS